MGEIKKFKCQTCGHEFNRSFGVDINGLAKLFCNKCGKQKNVDLSIGWIDIPQCECGGTFDADSLGTCPNCNKLLTPEDKN